MPTAFRRSEPVSSKWRRKNVFTYSVSVLTKLQKFVGFIFTVDFHNIFAKKNAITVYPILGLIVFCTGFGVILSILGKQAQLMINFFIVLDAIIMRWVSAVMWCV